MDFITIAIIAGIGILALLIGVHFAKKSAWYKKIKATGADVGDTISSALGWVASPWLWMFVFWVLYNPWGHSYFDFVKNYNFGEDNILNIVVVAVGAILTIISLYFLTKAWKKLAWLGHVAYVAFIGVYLYALYEVSNGDLSQVNVSLHVLVFLTVYAAWGMIYPKLSKKTHAEVGVNIDTDDVDAIANDD